MSSNNVVKISAAGAGKTWSICHDALETTAFSKKKVLITTYTNRGVESIRRELRSQNNGVLSSRILVKTWYDFLMSEWIRPYQSAMDGVEINEIKGFDFSKMYGYINYVKAGTKKRYLQQNCYVFANVAAELSIQLNTLSEGKVISRLAEIYCKIYFDEVQDLSGYDINILQLLCASNIDLFCCGDNKQATYSTHKTAKNKNCTGKNIWEFFSELNKKGLIKIEKNLISHRFNQHICCFANTVFPGAGIISTIMDKKTEHDGVFLINRKDVSCYYNYFLPQVLRYDSKELADGYNSVNFGACKGETFDRILIYPNNVFKEFILKDKAIRSPEKYYVAATRARYSIAFVLDSFPKKSLKNFRETEILVDNVVLKAYKFETSNVVNTV